VGRNEINTNNFERLIKIQRKAIAVIFSALFLISIFTVAHVAIVSTENGGIVVARLERHHFYEAGIFEDSISNVLVSGNPKQSYYIWALGGAVVTGAEMEMVTPHPNEQEYFPSIEWDPQNGDSFTWEGPVGGPYTYLWTFPGSIPDPESEINQAGLWIQTNFLEQFQLPFTCSRTWNPLITSRSVTQKLTVNFNPTELGGVHIQVRVESIDEASVEIISVSEDPDWPDEDFWFDEEDENGKKIGANWGGDPAIDEYTFDIEIKVVNEFFPEPIFYKPSVGLSLGFDTIPQDIDPQDYHVTIVDDVDGDGTVTPGERITYRHAEEDLPYTWDVKFKDDYDVLLPSYSVVAIPLQTTLQLSPSPVVQGETVIMMCFVRDLEENSIEGATVVATIGDLEALIQLSDQGSGEYTGAIDTANYDEGIYEVVVTARKEGYVESQTSQNLTINLIPLQVSLQLTPESIASGEDVELFVTVEDEDGNPVSGAEVTANLPPLAGIIQLDDQGNGNYKTILSTTGYEEGTFEVVVTARKAPGYRSAQATGNFSVKAPIPWLLYGEIAAAIAVVVVIVILYLVKKK